MSETQHNIIIYTDANENIKLNVLIQDETLWATQKQMAELFEVNVPAISKHLKNIFESQELEEDAVISILETTATDDKRYKTKFYNLDAIIAVGYRVNSLKATKFRIWATNVIKEFIIKGFVLDDERLKQSKAFGKDYFDELLERVRSIRASERRIYQKITDIFAECSIDYDKDSPITNEFYATVQNKFHYAIAGETAAEIIYHRVNQGKPYMGLTTWKNAPNGRILQQDALVAKNYLSEKEIKKLERTISTYFDYIENQIEIRKEEERPFTMEELSLSVNKFLSFNDFKILEAKGKISRQKALRKAKEEYREFNKLQKIESDFDKLTQKISKEGDSQH